MAKRQHTFNSSCVQLKQEYSLVMFGNEECILHGQNKMTICCKSCFPLLGNLIAIKLLNLHISQT